MAYLRCSITESLQMERYKKYFTSIQRTMIIIVLYLILFSVQGFAQNPKPVVNWDAWKFLIGEWVGEGGGNLGQGAGGFSLFPDVQGTVLIRKNYSEFPAVNDRPAFRHDDLTVIFEENGVWKAEYFDNERHVIHYTVSFSSDSLNVIFTGEANPHMPCFRLTYSKISADVLHILFEMAPPNNNTAFSKYIEATARKKK